MERHGADREEPPRPEVKKDWIGPAESHPAMIFVMHDSGRIAQANRAARQALGYDEEEIETLSLYDLVPPTKRQFLRLHLERVGRSGHDHTDAYIRTGGKEEKRFELISTAAYDEKRRFLGARIFLHDLTGQIRLEQERIKWERLVAVGSMAAKVAHEIRNPLSSISLNVELLLDEIRRCPNRDTTEATSLVNSILSEIDRLTSVIEEYLNFGRLPSPSLEPVPAEELLHTVAEFVRPDLRGHEIELKIEVHPGTPPILADRNQVRQSILNLFRNAQEAMPSGGKMTVVAGARDGDVVIEVRDSGVGIPKEKVHKIFDPFYTTKDYGTGLGLAFVQQVMREHGGRVTCRSTEGEGTIFSLYFPTAKG